VYSFKLVNLDTDSISICKPDGSPFSNEERSRLLKELNSIMPEHISWDDDGYFPSVVIIKAKNYVLYDGNKTKIKGSALKATTKELALKEFINNVLNILLGLDDKNLTDLYYSYVKEIYNMKDISRWSSKKTISTKVLNPERTNESRVLDAIENSDYREGDKIRVYFTLDGSLKLEENWNNDHDTTKLVEKLFKTVKIFETVLDIEAFPNFKLKRNQELLKSILNKI